MNSLTRTLTPPHPFRQRVVDPGFYLEHLNSFKAKVAQIIEIAQNLDEGRSPLAIAWAEQIAQMQNKNLLPNVSEELISVAQIGIAVAIHEEGQFYTREGETAYEYHAILAVLAMEDDKYLSIVRSLLLDGGYYLQRTKLSPEALGESTSSAF